MFVRTDVTAPDSVEQMVDAALDQYGRVDILHNNAGGSSTADGPVTEVPIDEWWRTLNIDLFGTFLCSRFAVPPMIQNGGGSVINMGSAVALVGTAGRDAYTAAKGGVVALTRSMAKNFRSANVRVNAIAPGGVATERILAMMGEHPSPWHEATTGIPMLAQPRDIADSVRVPGLRRGGDDHGCGPERRRGPRDHHRVLNAVAATRPRVQLRTRRSACMPLTMPTKTSGS